MRILFNIFFTLILLISSAFAQDSTGTQTQLQDSGIKVFASVSQKEIPLNRTLIFTIQVEWFGNLSKYGISEIETPTVRNFQIKSNASSDRRQMVDGELKAIKTFEFYLTPEVLGMGYIDGVIVKYIDTETGEGKHLMTNRLEAKVIDPLPEPGSNDWIYKWIIIAVIAIIIILFLVSWLRKRAEEKRRQAEYVPPVPLEEEFLKELKNTVALDSPDLDIKNGFSNISIILRRYLAEKYEFSATNTLLEEIVKTLKQNELQESLINNVEEILNKSDVVKFSGGSGEKADLERLYTLLEDLLNINLKNSQEVEKENK